MQRCMEGTVFWGPSSELRLLIQLYTSELCRALNASGYSNIETVTINVQYITDAATAIYIDSSMDDVSVDETNEIPSTIGSITLDDLNGTNTKWEARGNIVGFRRGLHFESF